MNPALPNPQQPGKRLAAVLTVLMHVVLALFLFYGVQWQSRPPETVTVDLVSSLPPMPQPTPQPKAEPTPTPPPPPPPPQKVERPPEPPKPVVKPDIELKAPKEKPKVEPKVEPKPEPKPEKKPDAKPRPEASAPVAKAPSYQDRLSEMLNKDAERARLDSLARADAARAANAGASVRATNASKDWADRIRGAIRPNIVLPPGVNGRPKPEFIIELMPDGEILGSPRLTRSSGIKQVDDAVENAIIKTKKLPMPSDPQVFQRQLKLVFDPYAPSN